MNKSNLEFNTDVDSSKKILTLVTCDKTGEKRFVINAVSFMG